MVSIIVPVYNEEKSIDKLLKNLSRLEGDFEVIFVDGGSTDGTIGLIPEEYSKFTCTKGRGAQMNLGAEKAKGEILFFLHCDSIVEEDVVPKIEDAIKFTNVGCLSIHFISKKWIMKICGISSRNRVIKRNIAFGDQGIFIKKEIFKILGGYREMPIMEDYQLSLDLTEMGERIVPIDSKIFTSDRRYKNNGYIKTMYKMKKYQRDFRNGKSIEKIYREYKDER